MADYQRLQFHETKHWVWQVHENQSYIGRTILLLKRNTELSFAQCSDEEWLHLKKHCLIYEEFLNALFKPDRFNYGQFGNIYPKLHIHLVPRYRSPRTWTNPAGSHTVTFIDHRWGSNWAPTLPSPMSIDDTYNFAEWFGTQFRLFTDKGFVEYHA